MEKKQMSFWWAIPIGLIFPVLQIAFYYLRFGEMNPYAAILDYLWYFLAGVAGAIVLILFLSRCKTTMQRWIVVVAFLLASPISTLMMVGGGAFGPIGVVLFPLVNWALFGGFGFLVGRFFSRKLSKTT